MQFIVFVVVTIFIAASCNISRMPEDSGAGMCERMTYSAEEISDDTPAPLFVCKEIERDVVVNSEELAQKISSIKFVYEKSVDVNNNKIEKPYYLPETIKMGNMIDCEFDQSMTESYRMKCGGLIFFRFELENLSGDFTFDTMGESLDYKTLLTDSYTSISFIFDNYSFEFEVSINYEKKTVVFDKEKFTASHHYKLVFE